MAAKERILVPLDGSARAERILPVVKELARRLNASALLLRVLPGDATASEEGVAQRYLSGVINHMQDSPTADGQTCPVSGQIVRGTPAREIQRIVETCRIALVAVTTHGRSGVSRWLLGSVAETIVRTAPVPVLLLNDRAPIAAGSTGRPARPRGVGMGPVLVPLDGSPRAEEVLPIASRLARALGTRLHLAEVLSPVPQGIAVGASVGASEWGLGEDIVQSTRDDASAALATISRRLQSEGTSVTTDLSIGFPPEHLLATIAREDAALVAMATHGRGGLTRALLGSVADHLVRHAPCPVLLLGPGVQAL